MLEMVFAVYPTFAFFCLLSPCSWVSWFPLRAQSLGFKSSERLEVLGRLRQVWVIRLDPVVSSTTFCLCTRRINGVLCLLWKKKTGLAWATDEQTLKEAFSSFGEVIEGTEASFPQTHILLLS